MLCEECQTREATVHFSAVAWPSGDLTNHLCETCYAGAEAKRTASYGPKARPLPLIDVERITAQEYLDFAASAHANSVDAPAFRHITKELERFPRTRERLGTEMLTMALRSLERASDAPHLVGLGSCFLNSAPEAKTPEFIQLLERIVLRSVELMAQSPNPPSDHPFGLGLTMAGNALRRADSARFSTLLEVVGARHQLSPSASPVLDYLKQRMAESEQRWRTKEGRDV